MTNSEIAKDLEEAADEYEKRVIEETKCHHNALTYAKGYEDALLLIPGAFIDGAKWQAEHTPLPEDTVLFNKGVEEGKRLMMEGAVEGEVVKDWDNNLSVKSGVICGFKFGEKVRVIVLPKED